MSKLYRSQIRTAPNQNQDIIITTIRTTNDTNGNPRYKVAVFTFENNTGYQWTPKVKGYRMNKDGEYMMTAYNLDNEIEAFTINFEKAVRTF